jgi:hypothetical protein
LAVLPPAPDTEAGADTFTVPSGVAAETAGDVPVELT